MIYLYVVTQYKTSPMRVAGLDARTHAIDIEGMAATESHLRVTDEYIFTSIFFLCVIIHTMTKLLV